MNLAKLKLVPVGNVPNVESLAFILGFEVSTLPMKYLDLPLGISFKLKSIWDKLLEKNGATNWPAGRCTCPKVIESR